MTNPAITSGDKPLRILLVGYNGANNTGAEALLLSNITDIRTEFGPDAVLTVPTLNPDNLRRYLRETRNLRIVSIPSIYFLAIRRLVKEHDLVVLVEGSCYMDTWCSALLWLFLWATRCAGAMHKPCLAYSVDAGKLSSLNRLLVRREASKTDLIIARSRAAADRLLSCGVTAPLKVTADNAFNFHPDPADNGWYKKVLPECGSGVTGIALVDFYVWPVVMRPWGRTEDCYKWPYFFSRSPDRRRKTIAFAEGYARLADDMISRHGKSVALICMEQVDEPVARLVHERMHHADKARIFSAREYNASQMTALLRSLDLLVTSRYHACVLSMAANVPQVAVGHDVRLATIYRDLGLSGHWFFDIDLSDAHAAGCFNTLQERVDELLINPVIQKNLLRRGYDAHLGRARQNRLLLKDFIVRHFGKAENAEWRTTEAEPATFCKTGAAWAA